MNHIAKYLSRRASDDADTAAASDTASLNIAAYDVVLNDGRAKAAMDSSAIAGQHQQPQHAAIVRPGADEILAPHVIGSLRPHTYTRSIVQPEPPSRLLFLRHFQPFPPSDPRPTQKMAKMNQVRRRNSKSLASIAEFCAQEGEAGTLPP
jgi:hypothetical protein